MIFIQYLFTQITKLLLLYGNVEITCHIAGTNRCQNLPIEKVLFWGQIFEVEILNDLHVLRSLESENHIFSGCSVCARVCLRV